VPPVVLEPCVGAPGDARAWLFLSDGRCGVPPLSLSAIAHLARGGVHTTALRTAPPAAHHSVHNQTDMAPWVVPELPGGTHEGRERRRSNRSDSARCGRDARRTGTRGNHARLHRRRGRQHRYVRQRDLSQCLRRTHDGLAARGSGRSTPRSSRPHRRQCHARAQAEPHGPGGSHEHDGRIDIELRPYSAGRIGDGNRRFRRPHSRPAGTDRGCCDGAPRCQRGASDVAPHVPPCGARRAD